MRSRPRIGVTIELDDSMLPQIDVRLREIIEPAGGLAIYIPRSPDPDAWADVYSLCDAILLMGGPDVDPLHYGAEAHEKTSVGPYPGYDTTELGLARQALADGKPLMGICRGTQVINVASGGTLIQDVPSTGTEIPHAGNWRTVADSPPDSQHGLRIDPASILAALLGAEPAIVNSYHHQAVDQTGPGMRAVAWAPDGIVEAIESRNGAFALGMQWHNEFHMRDGERYARPLQALIDATR